jgi:SAM-dependent methyltransferase
MAQMGPEFYDDEAVFATYQGRRRRVGAPNDTLEKPVLVDLIGAPRGLRVLDLGCGDAAIGRELLQGGAAAYVGIEGSHRMAALAAETLRGTVGQIVRQAIEAWAPAAGSCDLVLSRLALHYVADLAPILHKAHAALVPRGRLIFSVEHPVITSHDNSLDGGSRQDWVVDDYFVTGERVTQWMGGTVVKYHRTVEDYFALVQAAGLRVESLCEARPQPQHFRESQDYARRSRIPLFLILMARKVEQ